MTSSKNGSNFPDQIDRRKLFRVDETAILEVVTIDAELIHSSMPEEQFKDSSVFRLIRELRHIDQENASVLRNIQDRHADIALYLQSLNKKIDVMGQSIGESLLSEEQKLQSVDLSQGGIGFNHDKALEEGSTHAIKIWFHQTFIGLAVFIRVVASHRAIEGGYRISSAFENISDVNEQIIAKHIMQVQAQQQREKRDSDD